MESSKGGTFWKSKEESSPLPSSSEDEGFSQFDAEFINDLEEQEAMNEGFYKPEDLEYAANEVNKTIAESITSTQKTNVFVLKTLVSKKKIRFNSDGFNLDLTYITERVIAMGFPASKLESLFRNSMPEVQRFFNTRHTDHYRVYNLCAESKYQYDPSCFNNNVGLYQSYDHQAVPIHNMFGFCEDVCEWLNEHPENIAAVHCKAGKGRTGVMICCYLLYSKIFEHSLDALRYYGWMRTKNKKGVTIPSQIRYVNYFEKALSWGWTKKTIPTVKVALKKIKIYTIPNMGMLGGCSPVWRMSNCDQELYSRIQFPVKTYKSQAYIEWTGIENAIVIGDVLIQFYQKQMIAHKKKMFQVWFNTAFLEAGGAMTIEKAMLDKACKDRNHKIFSKDLRVEIQYEFIDEKSANQLKNQNTNETPIINDFDI